MEPSPAPGPETAQAAVPARNCDEGREAEQAAQEYELLQRVVVKQLLSAQVEAEPADDTEHEVTDGLAERVLARFVNRHIRTR